MKLWNDLLHLFFPRLCLLCDEPLVEGEKTLCLSCLYSLPRTHFHKRSFNPAEQLFAGKTPVTKATSYLYYEKGGKVQQLIYAIKYRGEKDAGFQMGKLAAAELYKEDFFEGINLIIPVPLHPGRQRRRGYNQAECIARGIASVAQIPVDCRSLVRKRQTNTQTHKNVFERWTNVQDIFHVNTPQKLTGKHILLVDDVLTTGATIEACAQRINAIEGAHISILTLSIA